MKQVIIINQQAKAKKLNALLKEMVDTFRKRNDDYAIHFTKKKDEANKVIATYHEPCRFYVCGGDGTLHQVINALQHTAHELVLIPCGTGNDFSRMLSDHKDIIAHFRHSLTRKATPIDILKVNDYYCINSACFALDNDIASHVHDHNWKHIPRKIAYLSTVLRRIFLYPCNEVSIACDGKNVFTGKVLFLACNNAKYYGGGFCMTPHASLNDGKMDVCIIPAFPRWKILYKCPPLFLKKPDLLKETISFQCHELTIHSKQGVNLDGEPYPDQQIQIEVIPNAILLVNKQK